MRLSALQFLGPRCEDVRLGASTGGQPSILGSSTSRRNPTLVKENDVTEGVPKVDPELCPSLMEHFLLTKDTVHQKESQEDQSLDGVRIDELYDPLVLEMPSDDEADVDEVDPIQALSDDEEGEPQEVG